LVNRQTRGRQESCCKGKQGKGRKQAKRGRKEAERGRGKEKKRKERQKRNE